MLLYPLLIQFTFKHFEDRLNDRPGAGLQRGITIGAILNAIAGIVRWLGALPSINGFCILFTGQTIAAIAQAFMLAIPPRLAVTWFPENEINMATSIAASANNLGIAFGCALTPLLVKEASSETDIPFLLLLQAVLCGSVLILIWIAFQKPAPYYRCTLVDIDSPVKSSKLWKQGSFIHMILSYSIIMAAQCAIITLLAQILIPPLGAMIDEKHVGMLGTLMLFVGFPASICVGIYLDRTLEYRKTCNILSMMAALSTLGLSLSIEFDSLIGIVLSCVCFGLSSYAIAPALFQYAGELFYPISEIIPSSYMFTIGNTGGVVFVAVMGWSENMAVKFSMRKPMICLTVALFISVHFMYRVHGSLKRSMRYQS
ncbi:major facilitator superfamily domain-containing protein [Mycotypha africana]|uniref:major facilitator superfamily domain-containing protein n=1 Tax=Mycotypha africana TaxID=64632 RepID=UPI0022FFC9D7|nr:major facilitator superfamily domain-containing protein [Mycotypha africana]KAI8971927.1 major facilitator superfamily domain-containing protein [Mycotypha africana]